MIQRFREEEAAKALFDDLGKGVAVEATAMLLAETALVLSVEVGQWFGGRGHSKRKISMPSAFCRGSNKKDEDGYAMFQKWMKLAADASMLVLESQQVIGLRLMKLTSGGRAASREATRMMTEKVAAFGEAAIKVATGGTTHAVLKGYRKKVRANRRRLTK